MINGPSVYDSGALGTIWPSPAVYDCRCWPIKKGFKSGRMVLRAAESFTEGPFIIFNSVRKSNFCTEILIKLRPLAIARTSLICAF